MFQGILDNFRDGRIKRGLIGGRPSSIDELFMAYADGLFGFALSITGRKTDAEDAVQNVFLRLVRNSQSLKDIQNLKAYLYRAVRNESINLKKRVNREIPGDPILELETEDPGFEEKTALDDALRTLPPEQMEVIVLRIYRKMNFREIGEILDISQNTVVSRYRYGLKALRKNLGVNQDG